MRIGGDRVVDQISGTNAQRLTERLKRGQTLNVFHRTIVLREITAPVELLFRIDRKDEEHFFWGPLAAHYLALPTISLKRSEYSCAILAPEKLFQTKSRALSVMLRENSLSNNRRSHCCASACLSPSGASRPVLS